MLQFFALKQGEFTVKNWDKSKMAYILVRLFYYKNNRETP
ncbi:hypothetical protein AOR13_3577 [Alteromonas stellipolaris LMG 21856]|nr:hypothetical protein AOR13_3577 [Alteromonas stellipolaris LMG 21856]